jgi:hypothetical protein
MFMLAMVPPAIAPLWSPRTTIRWVSNFTLLNLEMFIALKALIFCSDPVKTVPSALANL